MQDMSETRGGHFTYLFAVYEGGQEDVGFTWWRDLPEGRLAET